LERLALTEAMAILLHFLLLHLRVAVQVLLVVMVPQVVAVVAVGKIILVDREVLEIHQALHHLKVMLVVMVELLYCLMLMVVAGEQVPLDLLEIAVQAQVVMVAQEQPVQLPERP
jgi:hypothetical protein